jgi:hypothetical protein
MKFFSELHNDLRENGMIYPPCYQHGIRFTRIRAYNLLLIYLYAEKLSIIFCGEGISCRSNDNWRKFWHYKGLEMKICRNVPMFAVKDACTKTHY